MWECTGSRATRVVLVGMDVMTGVQVPLTSEHMGAHRVKEIWYRKSSFIKHKSGSHSSLFKRIPHRNPQN